MKNASLNEVCCLVTDGTHDTPARHAEGYPLVKAKEIVGGIIDFDSADTISPEEHLRVIARSKPELGDTLFAHIGASLGEAAYVNTSREFSIKNIALFKPDPAVMLGRYLYYLVLSPQFQATALAARTGSAQPFLSLGQLRRHVITYHESIDAQARIAAFLGSIDDLIENNNRRAKTLEEMAQRIYREWFVDFRYPGHEDVPLVDSELGPIPEGWTVGPLGDAMELVYGKALKADDRKGGAVRVFGSSGVVGSHDEAQAPGPGIVVGRKGNVGSVHWSQGPFFVIDTAFWVRTPLPLTYCYFVLRNMNFVDSHSSVPGLSRGQAYGLPLLTPTQPLVDRFDAIASQLFLLKEVLSTSNGKLRLARDLLLPRLISGEINVEHLDIPVGEAAA